MKFYTNTDISLTVHRNYSLTTLTVTRYTEKSFRLYNSKDVNGGTDYSKEEILGTYGIKIFSRGTLTSDFFVGTSDYHNVGTKTPPQFHTERRKAIQNHIENFHKLSMFFADNGDKL